jgi:hypothetical protein
VFLGEEKDGYVNGSGLSRRLLGEGDTRGEEVAARAHALRRKRERRVTGGLMLLLGLSVAGGRQFRRERRHRSVCVDRDVVSLLGNEIGRPAQTD